jgi:hypothetical protein
MLNPWEYAARPATSYSVPSFCLLKARRPIRERFAPTNAQFRPTTNYRVNDNFIGVGNDMS